MTRKLTLALALTTALALALAPAALAASDINTVLSNLRVWLAGLLAALATLFLTIGGLPPGLTLASDGFVSGVPTRGGNFSFWLELSDQDPPSASWCRPAKSQRLFTIDVGPRGSVPSVQVGPQVPTPSGGGSSGSVSGGG